MVAFQYGSRLDRGRSTLYVIYDVPRRASGVLLVCNILMVGGRAMEIISIHW